MEVTPTEALNRRLESAQCALSTARLYLVLRTDQPTEAKALLESHEADFGPMWRSQIEAKIDELERRAAVVAKINAEKGR